MTVTADIFDALCEHLSEQQTLSPALRIAFPLRRFTPRNEETYLRASILPNQTTSTSVGKGRDRHFGLFQVLVSFVANDEGLVRPLEIADAVVAQFEKGLMLQTAQGRKVKIPRTPWVSPVLPDPDRPMIPVSIPYEAGNYS